MWCLWMVEMRTQEEFDHIAKEIEEAEKDLPNCPFCGNTKITINEKRRGKYSRSGNNYQAVCSRCKARGPLKKDYPKDAADAWAIRITIKGDK